MTGVLRQATKLVAHASDQLRRPRRGLVVLVYHRVGAKSGIEVDLPVTLFEEQMARLACDDMVVDIDTAVAGLLAGDDLTGKVVVTFDDGTADFADVAVPILECYQVPATLYVATRYIDEQESFPDEGHPLSWAGLRDCLATGLVTVGSHTHGHALLDRVDIRTAARELDRSIELLEDELGIAADHFAYPKAVRARNAVEAMVRMRFRSAAVAGTRPNPAEGTDLHRLARSPVQVSDGLTFFEHKVQGGMQLEDDVRRLVNRRRYAGLTR